MSSSSSVWPCPSCTYMNDSASSRCCVCQANRGEQKESPIEIEIDYLKRLYPNSFTILPSGAPPCVSRFSLSFFPSAPDFPFALPVSGLVIEYSLTQQYPAQDAISMRIINPIHEVPLALSSLIVSSVSKSLTRSGPTITVRAALKWLDRNIDELLIIGMEMLDQKQKQLFDILQKQKNLDQSKLIQSSLEDARRAEEAKRRKEDDEARQRETERERKRIEEQEAALEKKRAAMTSNNIGFKVLDLTRKQPPQQAIEDDEQVEDNNEENKQTTEVKITAAPAAPAPATPAPAPVSVPAPPVAVVFSPSAMNWSAESHSALEAALKKYPKSMETPQFNSSARWAAIVAEVPGKTRSEVIERFKYVQHTARVSQERVRQGDSAAIMDAIKDNLNNKNLTDQYSEEALTHHMERVRDQHLDAAYMDSVAHGDDDDGSGVEDEGGNGEYYGTDSGAIRRTGDVTDATTAHRGTQFLCEGVELLGVPIVKLARIACEGRCLGCSAAIHIDTIIGPTNIMEFQCNTCACNIFIRFRGQLFHEQSPVFGYFDLENGELTDVQAIDCFLTCLSCFHEERVDDYKRGVVIERHCRECHSELAMRIQQFALVVVNAPRRVKDKQTNKESEQTAGVWQGKRTERRTWRLNTPLPGNGACCYYKKSFRWYRFPCCSRAFCCDRHHDEEEDHPFEWATKYICGKCSKEGPIANKVCSNCSASFVSRYTSHWEGGKGLRTVDKMSAKDRKKYAALNKTVSKHALEKMERQKGKKKTNAQ